VRERLPMGNQREHVSFDGSGRGLDGFSYGSRSLESWDSCSRQDFRAVESDGRLDPDDLLLCLFAVFHCWIQMPPVLLFPRLFVSVRSVHRRLVLSRRHRGVKWWRRLSCIGCALFAPFQPEQRFAHTDVPVEDRPIAAGTTRGTAAPLEPSPARSP
jgi:hypothetical protein